jgi:tetratricopeptide (TPR) repeat protein/tRNA A-37 threonylcarbamoyl transferase component Bud32
MSSPAEDHPSEVFEDQETLQPAPSIDDAGALTIAPVAYLPANDARLARLPPPDEPPAIQRQLPANPAPPGYEITCELARGGMGVVYKARQEKLKRIVALKMILSGGHAGAEDRARFMAEAEAIAAIAHPGIVQIHEFGTHEDLPFFALEFCAGGSLASKLNGTPLPPQESAQLVEQVARAVEAAHEQGIIHRDLKPANVLLGDDGKPRITDFGLARRMKGGNGLTQSGAIMGTPSYMAPEQAEETKRVGPAADVYALGAILYECLTGRPPFKADSAIDTILQVLSDEPVPPGQLNAKVPRDLETVTLKCLQKEPSRRYPTAQALADDLGRYLEGKPVQARRVRVLERGWRWARRNPVVAGLATAVLLVLLVGIAGTSWGLVRAQLARQAEQSQREIAEQNEQEAVRRLAQIEKGVELFAGLLTSIDPGAEEKGGQPLYDQLRERAEKAADQLLAEAVADSLAEARLQTIMGNTLRGLGSYARAIEVLQRARTTREQELEADHPDTLTTLNDLARTYWFAAKFPEAIELFEQVRDARVRTLGAKHPDTLDTTSSLAGAYKSAGKLPEAIALYQQVRDIHANELGAEHSDTLNTSSSLGFAYLAAGKRKEAIALFDQVRKAQVKKTGADHPDSLTTLHNLAVAYEAAGKLTEAIALNRKVRDARVKKLGAEHPSTLTTLHNLAGDYMRVGMLTEAIAIYQQVRDAKVKKLGADHRDTLATMNNLALAYQNAGKLAEAIALYQQVRDVSVNKLGADHPDVLTTHSNLGKAYQTAGKLAEALRLLEQAAVGVQQRRFVHEHAVSIIAATAAAHEAAKAWDRAESWRRALLAHIKEKSGAESSPYANQLNVLGWNLLQQHRWTEAEDLIRESLKLRQKLTPGAWATFVTRSNLGAALAGQGKHADAELFLLKAYEGLKARVKSMPAQRKVRLPETANRLVELYRAMKKDDEASKWQQTFTNIVGKLQEPIHEVGMGLTLKGQLDATTKALAYQVRLQAGTQYVITVSRADGKALAPWTVLTDEENIVRAECVRSGSDTRITYRAPRAAVYRVRASSANDNQRAFTLTVEEKKEEK